jgi:methionyl aminopeptidase
MSITLKTNQQISYMRQAGKIVAEALQIAKQVIKPGITTSEINDVVEKHIQQGSSSFI